MSRLILCTGNQGKLKEFRLLLGAAFEVVSYEEVFGTPLDVLEDGTTFQANALKKVDSVVLTPGDCAVSDDSGLVVAALDGEPGVYSARYGGEGLTSFQRCEVLLQAMQGKKDRSAYFQCVMAVKFEDGRTATVEGQVRGQLAETCLGDGGFGYDPVFIPDGYSETFATLPIEVKQRISHRRKAVDLMVELLTD